MYEDTPRRKAWIRWRNMVQRCTNPDNGSWPDYGGRGITVCDRWLDFDAYYADVGDAPEGMSLDRVDNDGPYSPENVQWATHSEQMKNRRPSAYGAETSRTHCPANHPYDEANTYRHNGHRYCRACNAASAARRRDAKRAKAAIVDNRPDRADPVPNG